MVQESEVRKFLQEFQSFMAIAKVIYVSRTVNSQTLLDLEIPPNYRDEVLKNLITKDYSEGPKENDQYGTNPMWVFGKEIKGVEVYIKITCSHFPNAPYCISFHTAKSPMNYPFKK